MNKEEIENFAREAAKGINTEQELSEFSQTLTKVVIETKTTDQRIEKAAQIAAISKIVQIA